MTAPPSGIAGSVLDWACSKLTAVALKNTVVGAGDFEYNSYVITGTLTEVTAAMNQLYATRITPEGEIAPAAPVPASIPPEMVARTVAEFLSHA